MNKEITTVYKEVRKLKKLARELFPDKKDQELIEPIIQEFKKVILENQGYTLPLVSKDR